MFKNLKQKIGDGLANSPARNILGQASPSQDGAARGRTSAQSTPMATPSGSLLDLTSPGQRAMSPSTPQQGPPQIRSRTSSISSQTSEAAAATISLSTLPSVAVTPSSLVDLEGSVSEAETEDMMSGTSSTALTKDELYKMYCKVLRRGQLYKSKLNQVLAAYKENEKEREKLKTTLTTTQDKSLRRISELKEQIELDKGAKQDLENNYTLMLDEKDELITVLRMQIRLLKEGKSVPDELLARSGERNEDDQNSTNNSMSNTDLNSNVSPEEVQALKEKIKRLEILLQKCKETITGNKERTQQLSANHEALSKQLQSKCEELDKLKADQSGSVDTYQAQLKEAKKLIKDLEADKAMSIASAKQELHAMIEGKDTELAVIHDRLVAAEAKATAAEAEAEKLRVAGEQQLEKSREIIKRLKEEKRSLERDGRQMLESSEQSLEQDKEQELNELRRGKVEALNVLQKQLEERVEEMRREREKALNNRDKEWMIKLEQAETRSSEELERRVRERTEELELAVEEQQLQRVAQLSQLSTELEQLKQNKRVAQLSQLSTELEQLKQDKDGPAGPTSPSSTNPVDKPASDLPLNDSQHKDAQLVSELTRRCAALESELQTLSYSHRRVVEERMEMEARLGSSLDTIGRLEHRISDLMDRENILNTELEQTKVDNERRLAAQTAEMSSMKELVEQLKISEEQLIQQMSLTNNKCADQLTRASQQNEQAIGEFMARLQGSQSELLNLLKELEITKARSNQVAARLQAELDNRLEQLDLACCQIEELGGERPVFNSLSPEALNEISTSNVDLFDGLGTLNNSTNHSEASLNAASGINAPTNGVTELSELRTLLDAAERERLLLVDKVTAYESALMDGSPTVEGLMGHISNLERVLREKDERIKAFEAKVGEFGDDLKREMEEMRERNRQIEQLMLDKDTEIQEKEKELQQQKQLLLQLKSEAKSRILTLKAKLQDKEAGSGEAADSLREMREEFDKERNDLIGQLDNQKEELERVKLELELKHASEVRALVEKLAQEEQSMYQFKEYVKKQAEERQVHMRYMIEKLLDNHSQSLKDRDEAHDISIKNLEREKNREKQKEVGALMKQIEELKSQLGIKSDPDQALNPVSDSSLTSLNPATLQNNDQTLSEGSADLVDFSDPIPEQKTVQPNNLAPNNLMDNLIDISYDREISVQIPAASSSADLIDISLDNSRTSNSDTEPATENLVRMTSREAKRKKDEEAAVSDCSDVASQAEEICLAADIPQASVTAVPEGELERLRLEREELSASLESLREAHDGAREDNQRQLGELEQTRARLLELEGVHGVLLSSLSSVKECLDRVEQECESIKQERDRFEAEVGVGKETIQRLNEECAQLRDQGQTSAGTANELEASRKELENLKVVSDTETERVREELGGVVKELEALKQEREVQAESVTYLTAELESERVRLREAISQHQSEKESLLRHLEADKGGLMEQLQALEAEKGGLIEKLGAFEVDKNGLAEQLQAHEASKGGLMEQLQALETEKAALSEQLQALEGSKGDLADKLRDFEANNADLVEQLKVLQTDKEGLMEKLQAVEVDKGGLAEQLQSVEADKTRLSEQLQALETELGVERQTVIDLRSESEALKISLEKSAENLRQEQESTSGLHEENERVRGEVGRLEEQVVSLEEGRRKEKDEHNERLEACNQEMATLKREIESMQTDKAYQGEQSGVLQEQLGELTRLNTALQGELEARGREVGEMREKIERGEGEMGKLKSEIEGLNEEKRGYVEEIGVLRGELEQIRGEGGKVEEKLRKIKEERDEVVLEKERLTESVQKLHNDLNDMNSANSSLRESDVALQGQLEGLTAEKEVLCKANEELQGKVDELNSEINSVKEKENSLQEQLVLVNNEKDGLSRLKQEQEKKVEELQESLKVVEEKLNSESEVFKERLSEAQGHSERLREESLLIKSSGEERVLSYEEKIKSLEGVVRERDQLNESLAQQLEELALKRKEGMGEVDALKGRLDQITSLLEEEKETRAKVEVKCGQLSDEVERLKEESERLREEIRVVQGERDRLIRDIDELGGRLKEVTSRNEALAADSSQAVRDLEARVKGVEEEGRTAREALAKELEAKSSEVLDITAEYTGARKMFEDEKLQLAQRLEALQIEKDQCLNDRDRSVLELEARAKSLECSLAERESAVIAAEASVSELSERCEEERKRMTQVTEDCRGLENEKQALQAQIYGAKMDIESKKAEIESLQAQVDRLKESLERVSESQQQAGRDVTEQERRLNEKEEKVQELKHALEQAQTEFQVALEQAQREHQVALEQAHRELENALEQAHREHQVALDAQRVEYEGRLEEVRQLGAVEERVTQAQPLSSRKISETSGGWEVEDADLLESPSKSRTEQEQVIETLRIENQRLAEEVKTLRNTSRTGATGPGVGASDRSMGATFGGENDTEHSTSTWEDAGGWGSNDDFITREIVPKTSASPQSRKAWDRLQGASDVSDSDASVKKLREEYEAKMKHMEEDHNNKVIQLVKDFNSQMNNRERDLAESFGNDTSAHEARIAQISQDHKHEVRELHELLDERDARTEQLVQEYEAKIKKQESQSQSRVDQLNLIIEDLQQQLVDKEYDLEKQQRSSAERDMDIFSQQQQQGLQESRQGAAQGNAQARVEGVAQTRPEGVAQVRSGSVSDVLMMGNEDALQSLELQNMNLQAEVNRHLADLAKSKLRERELKQELDVVRVAAGYSGRASSTGGGVASSLSGTLLSEPTELEYLRNILFKYMTGLETKTLAKVICTVVKFTDEQTRVVLDKEESKNSAGFTWSPSNLLYSSASPSPISSLIGSSPGRPRPPSTRRTAHYPVDL